MNCVFHPICSDSLVRSVAQSDHICQEREHRNTKGVSLLPDRILDSVAQSGRSLFMGKSSSWDHPVLPGLAQVFKKDGGGGGGGRPFHSNLLKCGAKLPYKKSFSPFTVSVTLWHPYTNYVPNHGNKMKGKGMNTINKNDLLVISRELSLVVCVCMDRDAGAWSSLFWVFFNLNTFKKIY